MVEHDTWIVRLVSKMKRSKSPSNWVSPQHLNRHLLNNLIVVVVISHTCRQGGPAAGQQYYYYYFATIIFLAQNGYLLF